MATSANRVLTSAFVAVAQGPGDVTFTRQSEAANSAFWAISTSATPLSVWNGSTGVSGHYAEQRENVSLTLLAGEYLQLRGPGVVTITAEVPVA